MFQIDSNGSVAGMFSEGDPSTGTPGTKISADWLNAVQQELVNFIQSRGLTLDKGNSAQLAAAIVSLFPITRADLAAVGQQKSSSCGLYAGTTSGIPVDVPSLSVALTTSGRPVVLAVQPDGSSPGQFNVNGGDIEVSITRDGTTIATWAFSNSTASVVLGSSLMMLDTAAPGTHTYKVQIRSVVSSINVTIWNCVLVAYEL